MLTATEPFAYSFMMNFTFSNCVSCLRDFYFRRFVFLPTRSARTFMLRMLLHGNPHPFSRPPMPTFRIFFQVKMEMKMKTKEGEAHMDGWSADMLIDSRKSFYCHSARNNLRRKAKESLFILLLFSRRVREFLR